jgi:hypothetical protein
MLLDGRREVADCGARVFVSGSELVGGQPSDRTFHLHFVELSQRITLELVSWYLGNDTPSHCFELGHVSGLANRV